MCWFCKYLDNLDSRLFTRVICELFSELTVRVGGRGADTSSPTISAKATWGTSTEVAVGRAVPGPIGNARGSKIRIASSNYLG